MHVEARFPPAALSVRAARDLVRAALEGMTSAVDRERVVLAVSELATNATLYSPAGPFRVTLDVDGAGVHLAVADCSNDLPIRRTVGPEASSGRGLAMVEALSSCWGVERSASGKCVWCDFLS